MKNSIIVSETYSAHVIRSTDVLKPRVRNGVKHATSSAESPRCTKNSKMLCGISYAQKACG